jgi:hypothetical protein
MYVFLETVLPIDWYSFIRFCTYLFRSLKATAVEDKPTYRQNRFHHFFSPKLTNSALT